MKRLDSRKADLYNNNSTNSDNDRDDLNIHNINVVSDGAHVFKLAEARTRLGDGRGSIEEIISYLDWVLDRENAGYGSFKYACDLENINPTEEARNIVTRLFESNNNLKIRNYMGGNFDSFIEDLNVRFTSIYGNPKDPLHQ